MTTVYRGAIEDLGARVVHGGLPPGTAITLDWIGREFDVSRTVAREVVQVLVSMGLVESRRRTGVTVRPCEEWDAFDPAVVRWRLAGPDRRDHLRELSQLRAAVEPAAAALAAERVTPELAREVVAMGQDLEQTGRAGDLRTFLEHDVRFHRTLLAASGNVMFAGLADTVEEVLRGRTDHDLMPPHPKPEARALHQEVARAVAGGEPEAARVAMRGICDEVTRGIDELLAGRG